MKFLAPIVPSFSASEAQALAERHFGLAGELEPLYSERDQNFRLRASAGDWTLKIISVEETPEVVDCQIRALRHIERVDPGLQVPRVHPTLEGGSSTSVSRGGHSHIVYLLSYLPGVIAEKVPLTGALLRHHGGMVARLGRAMRGFFHPAAGGRELLWDVRMAARFLPHVAKLDNPGRRETARAFIENFAATVMPRLEGMRAQLIHGDVGPHNLLVDPADADRITGIIDFGDMIHAPLILDLASAAADFLLDKAGIVDVIEAVTDGYHAVTPLEPAEAEVFYDLIVMRLLLAALIAAWRMAETPDSPNYLNDNFEGKLLVLDEIQRIGREAITRRIRRVCGLPARETPTGAPWKQPSVQDLLKRRHRLMGRDLPIFYDPPMHLVRGRDVWLFDAEGRRYLDVYNNVAHVGHCHPRVVEAIVRQARLLNTNTRYLGTQVIEYCERLSALFPGRQMVSAFVNSGSEANDIAWRMAKAYTGNTGGLIMEFAYHGITEAVDALSPSGSRTGALAPHVRALTAPDDYRGPFKRGEADLAGRYAASADAAIASLREAGLAPAAFIIDSTFLTNGVLEAPPGYLAAVFAKVRAAGGLCIADEVQAGFGRMGKTMWGHQHYDVVPDIVTLGKPVGNGHPLGVVITTPEIMEAFLRETSFFSTFGGNNVSAAAGLAVLDVIEEERLIENATEVGAYLKHGLQALKPKHGVIGDVRGVGLVAGIELVSDRRDLTPAKSETQRLLNLMRDEGVFVGREGLHGNIVKLRPPIVFSREHADITIAALDWALGRL